MSGKNLFDLSGKAGVVTGAGRGLGKAMALALAEAGADLVLADLDEASVMTAAAEIAASTGRRIESFALDVADARACEALIHFTTEKLGALDVLFNNAGIAIHGSSIGYQLEDWQRVFDVNVRSVFVLSRAAAARMMEMGRGGSIVNTASMSGLIVNNPLPQAPYNTSKAAVIHLTKCLAMEWVKNGIRVNAIAPGYMRTDATADYFASSPDVAKIWMEFTPMGRAGEPRELGGAAVFLASDASSFVTGQVIVADGGYTVW